jgi:hypothetical protein
MGNDRCPHFRLPALQNGIRAQMIFIATSCFNFHIAMWRSYLIPQSSIRSIDPQAASH